MLQVGPCAFVQRIQLTTRGGHPAGGEQYICLHRQLHRALQLVFAASSHCRTEEAHGNVTMRAGNHELARGQQGRFFAQSEEVIIAQAFIGQYSTIYIMERACRSLPRMNG